MFLYCTEQGCSYDYLFIYIVSLAYVMRESFVLCRGVGRSVVRWLVVLFRARADSRGAVVHGRTHTQYTQHTAHTLT